MDGSLNKLTYPSTDAVTYTVGGAGRPTEVSDSGVSPKPGNNFVTFSKTAANPVMYTPNGALASMTNGYTSAFAGIVTSNSYNNRLQPTLLSAATSQPIFRLSYGFNPGSDNGNVAQIVNNLDSNRSVAFTYDSLNRIWQANTVYTDSTKNSECWGEAYTIDAWGNLTNIGRPSGMSNNCSGENVNHAPATTHNQLTGILYDIAGNVIADGNGNQLAYDAESTLANFDGVTYDYDADGVRVEKSSGTMYWPGPGGEVLAETDLTGTINEEYVYFNGSRIARVDRPSGTVHYYFSDHLGSASVIADSGGNVELQEDFFPYGGIAYTSGNDPNHYQFTGKERDSESGLDDFGARYYTSNMGRFLTPDWAAKPTTVPYAKFGDPQTLNLYAYVENGPVNRVDADGHAENGVLPGVDGMMPQNTLPVVDGGTFWVNNSTAAPTENPLVVAQNKPAESVTAPFPIIPAAPAIGKALGAIADVVGDALGSALGVVLVVFTPTQTMRDEDYLKPPPSTSQQGAVDTSPMAAHSTGERESTRQGHERGEARAARDRGGEKGDKAGTYPRKPPNGWRTREFGNKSGKWPPTSPRDQGIADGLMGR